MFTRKTVLIVGSGASREVGLPTGPELAVRIGGLLNFEFEFGNLKNGGSDFIQGLLRHLGATLR